MILNDSWRLNLLCLLISVDCSYPEGCLLFDDLRSAPFCCVFCESAAENGRVGRVFVWMPQRVPVFVYVGGTALYGDAWGRGCPLKRRVPCKRCPNDDDDDEDTLFVDDDILVMDVGLAVAVFLGVFRVG